MRSWPVVAAALALVLAGSVPFAVTVSPHAQTVAWEDTTTVGVSESVVRQVRASDEVLPRAQVFYSKYRYVVGYYGITSLLATSRTDRQRSLGRPLTVYVSDFSGTSVGLTDRQTLRVPDSSTGPGWVPATEAYFVVDSEARIPSRDEAIVPFSHRADAEAFARRYDGRVRRWDDLQNRSVGSVGRTASEWRDAVDGRERRADGRVSERRELLDRPTSIVVGRDVPTLRAAVERAPPNTTIRLPPGTYDVGSLSVEKPLTVRGAGPNATRIVGDGRGTVVTASAGRTAFANLSLSGVGPTRSGANESPENVSVGEDSWLFRMRQVHGHGDAAITFDEAPRSLVADVQINTTSNGVVARDSPGLVVDDLTLYGTKRWRDGFLGVAAIGGSAVVQDSEFYGGKVGVFVLDAPNVVVRDSSMEGMMLGVFDLYGAGLTVSRTAIEDTGYGVYVESRSYDAAVVNSSVTRSVRGLIVSGTANYVAGNVLAGNTRGILIRGHFTLYTHNVIAYDRVGVRAMSLLPTNRVTENDVVACEDSVTTSTFNVLHVWRGNYWSAAPGVRRTADGHLRREFYPTSAIDRNVGRIDGMPTVAWSPALRTARRLRQSVSGLQSSGVVDPNPRAGPVRAARVERLRARYDEPGRTPDDDPWDFVA